MQKRVNHLLAFVKFNNKKIVLNSCKEIAQEIL